VGVGFRARRSRAEWRATPLPQLEHPDALIRAPDDRPPPVGFGPIGRHWQPRLGYAGSYDERWCKERAPLLPTDFDERFHQAAPPDQILAGYLQGGEAVEVVGCTAGGPLRFAMPGHRPRAWVRMRSRDMVPALRCESVTVDVDRSKLVLLYRAAVTLPGEILDVRDVGLDLAGDPS
jgi:hypothetical protein